MILDYKASIESQYFLKTMALNVRTRLAYRNIIASFLVKGWSGVVQLMLVPLTIACLGSYLNGVWMTVAAVLLWIDNMDIGLANGLRNRLAEARSSSNNELGRVYVSTTFFSIAVIMITSIIVMGLLYNVLDFYSILNIDQGTCPDLSSAFALAIVITGVTFIFKISSNVYLALQLPAVSNLILALSHTATLIGVLALRLLGSSSLTCIAIAYTLSPLLVNIAAFVYTFVFRYPELCPSINKFRFGYLGDLLTLGIKFFLLQMASVVLFMSSSFVVSNLLSPESVTPYQVAYRYFSLALIVFSIIITPFWSATTDAFAKGDYGWISNTRTKFRYIILMMAFMLLSMLLISKYVFHYWVGDEIVVPVELSVCMSCYLLIIMYSQTYSFFLNGIGALNIQLIVAVIAAIIYIPLARLMCSQYGLPGVCLALIIVNLPGAIINLLQFNYIIGKKTVANGK